METKVISKEYVKNNYVPNYIIEKEIDYHRTLILQIENVTMLKPMTEKEKRELEMQNYIVSVLNKILKEAKNND